MTLDEIAAAAAAKRAEQQREGIRQMTAAMATEIEQIKAEDWKAPDDVPYTPELPAPADWFVREAIAKAKRDGELESLIDHAKQGEIGPQQPSHISLELD